MAVTSYRLLFSKSPGLVSRLIRWFTRSHYLSHAAGNFQIFGADVVLESSEKGVEINTVKSFTSKNKVEAVVKPISGVLTTEAGLESQLKWVIDSFEGAPYDWMAAGSIGIMTRIAWMWKVWGVLFQKLWNKKAVHCTEVWVRFLQHAGYSAVSGMTPELTSPIALLRALFKTPSEFVVDGISPGLKKELEES